MGLESRARISDQGGTSTAPAPRAAENLRASFQPLEGATGVLLAVSGGPDSIALMLLAADWARQLATPPPLWVATVDHGLRPQSRPEAELVASFAARLGLPHQILAWEGEKPKTRIQERARLARYDLLTQHAAEIGASHLVTAHHADDQAETILFRLLRGSGLTGLAGMEVAAKRGAITHCRPLLACTKADLIAVCTAKGHAFIEDPSNSNPAYARARLRDLSGFFGAQGLDRDALLRLGRRAQRAEAALTARTEVVRGLLAATRSDGLFAADIGPLRTEPEEIVLRILDCEIRALAASDRPLRLERLESLTAKLHLALREKVPFSATLGGAALHLDAKLRLTICREERRRRGLSQG
ncbi:MAG TPA: tRNA lysidine(34) synthetase TilS [Beijerinckia sp.]|jgi:tRNA(Ile)-lysidine synthase|nr:tRNA lysidine(34) synthetase TilS [Beijerinckia sp.]